jgi:hypothetical protein
VFCSVTLLRLLSASSYATLCYATLCYAISLSWAAASQADVLVFLEPGVLPLEHWLGPLLATLDKHPHSGNVCFACFAHCVCFYRHYLECLTLSYLFFVCIAVVYPGVDVVEEAEGGGEARVRPSGNAVAAFDWALRSRWEVRS